MQKNQVGSLSITMDKKPNLKWIRDINARSKIVKQKKTWDKTFTTFDWTVVS